MHAALTQALAKSQSVPLLEQPIRSTPLMTSLIGPSYSKSPRIHPNASGAQSQTMKDSPVLQNPLTLFQLASPRPPYVPPPVLHTETTVRVFVPCSRTSLCPMTHPGASGV